jgi:NAD(P)H-quinone oxidoreductase subunit 5
MTSTVASLIVFAPVAFLSLGLCPGAWADRNARRFAALSALLAWAAFGTAVLAAGSAFGRLPVDHAFFRIPVGPFALSLSLYFDALTGTMLLLVSFLGALVVTYSRNYLAGDAGQGRFTRWLCLTIGAVLTLVVSDNMLLFALAWIGASLSLHRLLTFYPDRPGAVIAARKKFIISRLGDLCLIAAIIAIYAWFGSLEFSRIFAASESLSLAVGESVPVGNEGPLALISVLLVFAALLKSAQFPFHSWPPEVMETPTPVSALMHAGIINAGGFLIVRMSRLLALSPHALDFLAVIGTVTALYGSLVMLTQTSIKKSLAFSTVGQMGFMMLQCGLGAFSAAVLHIVAHALYKAKGLATAGFRLCRRG